MPVDEFLDRLGLPQAGERKYSTVAGLILTQMGRLPQPSESFEYSGWILEVVDLDGVRIDKVLVHRAAG
jgi:putative hemolysin